MALLDFLKNKKKDSAKTPKVKETQKTEKRESISTPPKLPRLSGAGFSYDAIKQPHISEKASYLAEKDQYVFEVLPGYNKKEIKDAVEGIYGVNVLSVNKIRIPHKKRRLGRTEGFRKAYTKAIVKIKEGQKIEIL